MNVDVHGFSAVALDNPKTSVNVGSVLRAAGCFGVKLVVLGSPRCRVRACTDTTKVYRDVPTLRVENVFDAIPFNCIPIGVDLIEGAHDLRTYTHPERAFYIFGAEDQTLGKRILSRCRDIIRIPSYGCLNLAAAVNVVLYDRVTKRGRKVEE